MKLTVTKVEQETKDAVSVSFKNNRFLNKVKYKPGQFLTLNFKIDGEKFKRAYSFSSSPVTDKELKITVKRVQGGKISNYICDSVKAGDKIEVEPAAGGFYVEPDLNRVRQYVLFAGGSGVTPVMSITKSVLEKEPESKVLVIFANQDESSIIFHEEFKCLASLYPSKLKVEHILTHGVLPGDNYHEGLATSELIEEIFQKHNLEFIDHHYMICGPFGYMETIKEILNGFGITRDKIRVEVFKPPTIKLSGEELKSEVTMNMNGTTYVMNAKGNKTLLEQALANNLAIPYSCRSGMCSSCKGVCTTGEVKMMDGHILDPDEVNRGVILTCVSYPVSEKVVIDF